MQDDDEEEPFPKQLLQETLRAVLSAAIPVIMSALMSRYLPEESDNDHHNDDRF
ncbi:hypothetical protein [Ferrimonas sp. YFM]|uniref:hypothetical protein n=1 Tax=Ferrimonas sp. YFM TaxID=3028878 RepID=UPI002572B1FB|nr:hypothetical protein [Ferrimonas sp. YFM]BDY04695.1 hypothetical protein F0521_17360 [Ferrimonas sp. YFM]